MDQQTSEQSVSFIKMGNTYQEKVVQALLQDYSYADQMSDVLDPGYFTLKYLQHIVSNFFSYKQKYKKFPTVDLIEILIQQDEKTAEDLVLLSQVRSFLVKTKENPLNGDMKWVQDNSLEFCQRQALISAVSKVLDKVDEKDYGSIQSIIKDALNKGAPRDAGHEYQDNLELRTRKSVRDPISTGWPPIDKILNGGWEKGTLTTFIAPTGAGKSMFLVNIACAAIEQGLNALYCTLEMADWKIGLRADSYFSGIPINDISQNEEKVKSILDDKLKGRLIIKEWPTKQATVQTIRSHLQKLEQTKNFKPDILLVDYADLLRGTKGYGEKRYELEGIYEELRALAQEFNVVLITADQTNRAGLNDEIVTLASIAESFAKATVCDLIVTVSRRMEDKQNNTGRLFVAKSRLGDDGVVFNFILKTATVKVKVLDQQQNPIEEMMKDSESFKKMMADRHRDMAKGIKS